MAEGGLSVGVVKGLNWDSPMGNLHVSMIWGMQGWATASLQVAEALNSLIAREIGINTAVKWPNDILVEGEKIAGILVETGHVSGCGDYMCVGIGVNMERAPSQSCYPTCSLREFMGENTPTVEAFLEQVLSCFDSMAGPCSHSWTRYASHCPCPMVMTISQQKCYAEWTQVGRNGEWIGEIFHKDQRRRASYSSVAKSPVPLLWYHYERALQPSTDPFDLIPLWLAEIGNSHVRVVKITMRAKREQEEDAERLSWWEFVDDCTWTHDELFPEGFDSLSAGAHILRMWLWKGTDEPEWLAAAQATTPPYFIVSTNRVCREAL